MFHASLEGGRAACTIEIDAAGLRVTTGGGQAFTLGYAGMLVELGGASGRMLFCRSPGRELTVFSEDPRLVAALKAVGPRAVVDAVDALTGRAARGRAFGWAAAAVVVALLGAAIAAAPALLRAAAGAVVERLPYAVDEKLGEIAAEQAERGGEEVDAPEVVGALAAMIDRLRPAAQRLAPGLPLDLRVRAVAAAELNAFALPGGRLTVYSGLLAAAERPEQVAGVVAHEISHVLRRHGTQRIAQSLGVVALMQLVFGDASGLVGAGRDLLTVAAINDYSQAQELQADDDAVTMMLGAGLDPRALAELFAIMRDRAGGAEQLLSAVPWLGTHPELDARIAAIERRSTAATVRLAPLAIDWPDIQRALPAEAQPGAER